jgi:hypothetical protein
MVSDEWDLSDLNCPFGRGGLRRRWRWLFRGGTWLGIDSALFEVIAIDSLNLVGMRARDTDVVLDHQLSQSISVD